VRDGLNWLDQNCPRAREIDASVERNPGEQV
jgi:hypothetical protein